jgi:hypothetical protein
VIRAGAIRRSRRRRCSARSCSPSSSDWPPGPSLAHDGRGGQRRRRAGERDVGLGARTGHHRPITVTGSRQPDAAVRRARPPRPLTRPRPPAGERLRRAPGLRAGAPRLLRERARQGTKKARSRGSAGRAASEAPGSGALAASSWSLAKPPDEARGAARAWSLRAGAPPRAPESFLMEHPVSVSRRRGGSDCTDGGAPMASGSARGDRCWLDSDRVSDERAAPASLASVRCNCAAGQKPFSVYERGCYVRAHAAARTKARPAFIMVATLSSASLVASCGDEEGSPIPPSP